MVRAVDFRLYFKERFRIAGVGAQIGRHGGGRQEEIREEVLVGANDGVGGREDVQVRFAVVGVHGGFDGVADVVDGADVSGVHGARIGVRVGGGIAVHNPHQAPGIGDHQVRIGVPFEEAGQLVEPVADFAPDHHAAVGGEIVGQQNVGFAFHQRGGEAHRERRNREAALAFIVAAHVAFARGVVKLLLRGVDEHRFVSDLAVVQFRPRQLQAGSSGARRRILNQQHRHTVWRDLADRRHHHAVAVGVDDLRIDPALVYVGQLVDVELARRQKHLAVAAVDGIAVDVGVFENVIRAQRLDLGDGVVKGMHVPQTHVFECGLVVSDVDGRVGLRMKLHLAHVRIQVIGAPGGVNMSLYVGPLERNFVGRHVECAHEARHGESQYQRDGHECRLHPASHPHQHRGGQRSQDQQPLHRETDLEIHPVDADHERTVLVVHHLVAVEVELHHHGQQQGHGGAAQEPRLQSAFQPE